uniref:MATH domain-containing protein n=2 Tax=Brassica oleracea var. oleracea TaxID=109376 RepID=A0A0D3DU56_BRAOL
MESLFVESEQIVYIEVRGDPVYDVYRDEGEKNLNEIYGSPIFDDYDGVGPIFADMDPIVSIFDEVEFLIGVCSQDAKTINFVFGDKALEASLNFTCSNALAKESLSTKSTEVASVRCIFEKHPDLASKVRSNNQNLKSTYMNVLLGLIETLCQLPENLSDDDLSEASAAVLYLKQVGFKMDWLEKKLQKLKERKKKMNTGKAQLQHMEEEFKILNKKCLDLKDLLDKQNEDLSAANVAFSFDDVV